MKNGNNQMVRRLKQHKSFMGVQIRIRAELDEPQPNEMHSG